MEFIFGIFLGGVIGWLICIKVYIPNKVVAGNRDCKKLKQRILFSFDNIDDENIFEFKSEVTRILALYGSVKATDDTHFVLTKSTACLGKIHNALTREIHAQPVELASHSIKLSYVSLSAEGDDIVSEFHVTIHATPGSTITFANRSDIIKVGESGRARARIRISRDELLKGYVDGKATKGGLMRDIRIAIT